MKSMNVQSVEHPLPVTSSFATLVEQHYSDNVLSAAEVSQTNPIVLSVAQQFKKNVMSVESEDILQRNFVPAVAQNSNRDNNYIVSTTCQLGSLAEPFLLSVANTPSN